MQKQNGTRGASHTKMYAQYIHLVTHELPELYPACHMNSYYSSSVFLCKYSGGKKSVLPVLWNVCFGQESITLDLLYFDTSVSVT